MKIKTTTRIDLIEKYKDKVKGKRREVRIKRNYKSSKKLIIRVNS